MSVDTIDVRGRPNVGYLAKATTLKPSQIKNAYPVPNYITIIMPQSPELTENQLQESILPTSYVLWLTWRSQFLDLLAQEYKDFELNSRFREYEAERIMQLEQEVYNE